MICSFDIETYNENNKLEPYCISFKSDKESKIFFGKDCIDLFINFIFDIARKIKINKKKKLIIFSHNLTFDGSILIQNIKKEKQIKYDGVFFKGNIYSLIISINDNERVTFKCSYRFFPNKLENANKLLETTKKIEFDHNKINKNNFSSFEEEIKLYCTIDSIIVFEIISIYDRIITKFEKNWINQTNSIPGVSLLLFLKKFNTFKIKIETSEENDNVFRPAYFGGRCEIFGNAYKSEEIYHFDFTGMYSQVMKESFNYGEFEILREPTEISNNGFFFIEAYSETYIPILPYHSKENNKLLFPNGYINGLYWWEEIILFIKNGGKVNKIKYQIRFKNSEKIFINFIEVFSEMRKKSKEENVICKLIINSIYGRLGMSEITTKTKLFNKKEYENFVQTKEKKIKKESWVNDLVFVEYFKDENNETKKKINSNVAIAAMITSKARIKLFNGFMSVIKNKGRLLYCDTDSIFVAFKKNVDNCKFDEIDFDINKKDTKIKKAIFALPKAYSLILSNDENITKIKGINNNNMKFEDFKKMFTNNSKTKFNISFLKKTNFIITPSNIEKIINLGSYDKRKFKDNKRKKTTPLFIKKED